MSARSRASVSLRKEDYVLLADFRFTLRTFLGFSEDAAMSHGVSSQQYQALLAIEGFPGKSWVTMGELAAQLRVAHHSAVGLVDRMETLGLVRREKAVDDRRRVQITLSAKGRGVLAKLYLVHRAELKTMGPKLIGLLQKASANITEPPERHEYASPACFMPEIED